MFDTISERLQGIFNKLSRQGIVQESHVDEAMREIRIALLEADVSLPVVKTFIQTVKAKAIGQDILKSLSPTQQIIKVVHEELTHLLGNTQAGLTKSPSGPTIILLVGLQGSGKTTTAGKLANFLRKQKRKPMLVALDIYRPAAIDQLTTLGRQLDIPVFSMGTETSPVTIAKKGIEKARELAVDTLLLDSAGRLHLDDAMMEEVKQIKETVHPHEVLLVVDAMTGQDAVKLGTAFHEKIGIDGIILTKLDGDSRGGAALSMVMTTGKPIKFIGSGEKLDALEPFFPDRLASRILGMGDVLSLIEQAQQVVNEEEAAKLFEKSRKAELTLTDFANQMKALRKMGPLEKIMGMIPGFGDMKKMMGNEAITEQQFNKVEAIINSMTVKERDHIEILDGSRRARIAKGSGTQVQDVNKLITQFKQARTLLAQLTSGKLGKLGKQLKLPKGSGGFPGFPF